jgi:hypothetical protein
MKSETCYNEICDYYKDPDTYDYFILSISTLLAIAFICNI